MPGSTSRTGANESKHRAQSTVIVDVETRKSNGLDCEEEEGGNRRGHDLIAIPANRHF